MSVANLAKQLEGLDRRELQRFAKLHGVKANGKSSSIATELAMALMGGSSHVDDNEFDEQPEHDQVLKANKDSMPSPRLTPPSTQHDDSYAPDQVLHSSKARPATSPLSCQSTASWLDAATDTATETASTSLAALKLRSRVFGTRTSVGPSVAPTTVAATANQEPTYQPAKTNRILAGLPSIATRDGPPSEVPQLIALKDQLQTLAALAGLLPTGGSHSSSTDKFVGAVLHGPRGCGKKLLSRTVAAKLKARYVLLDMAEVLKQASSPEQAGTRVKEACQAVSRSDSWPVVFVVDNLEAISQAAGDKNLTWLSGRARAELLLGLAQIKQASSLVDNRPNKSTTPVKTSRTSRPASSPAPSNTTATALVIGIGHNLDGLAGLDAAIIRNLLGTKSQSVSPARPTAVIEQAQEQDAAVIHVPLPDQDTREWLLYTRMCEAEAELTADDMASLARRTQGMTSEQVLQLCARAGQACADRAVGARQRARPGIILKDFDAAWGEFAN